MYARWIRPRVEAMVIRRAIANAVEQSYRDDAARHYVSHCRGRVTHHFVDDALLVA